MKTGKLKVMRNRANIKHAIVEISANGATILSSPPPPSPALAHEHVRKVRSVQKSRGVIYHLQMIASRAVKAIRFNACIHAMAKSLSRVFRWHSFFFSLFLGARTSYAVILDVRSTSIARIAIINVPWIDSEVCCSSSYPSDGGYRVTEFTGLRRDSIARVSRREVIASNRIFAPPPTFST